MMRQQNEMTIGDYRLVLTCGGCPEQYDVFKGDALVGYLRLRHGYFRADAPFGNTIYETSDVVGDGIFDDEERQSQLEDAIGAIDRELTK